jgi:hypothetical protein
MRNKETKKRREKERKEKESKRSTHLEAGKLLIVRIAALE